jgi:hypothetical protein
MPLYRRDRSEVNVHGQTVYYTVWMAGRTLAAIRGCVCEDRKRRTVNITGDPDTFFSIPANTKINGKHTAGYVTMGENGIWLFRANGGATK